MWLQVQRISRRMHERVDTCTWDTCIYHIVEPGRGIIVYDKGLKMDEL